MPACFTTGCVIKSLPLSDPSQSINSPPAAATATADTRTEKNGMQLSSLHVEAGSRKEEELERPTPPTDQTDIWSSILSGKENEGSKMDLPPPYIHPTVRRSASSLSDKSLEICTESLGSETGSDGFSGAYPPHQEELDVHMEVEFGSDPIKRNGGYCNRSALPPPMPSLSLRMRSRRQNGRLVMQTVSPVEPTKTCFRAERQNGRLLLTFSDHNPCDQQGNNSPDLVSNEESEEIIVPEYNDVADRDDDVARVTSAGGLSRPYVNRYYWRYNNKLQPCKRTMLLLKEPHCIVTS